MLNELSRRCRLLAGRYQEWVSKRRSASAKIGCEQTERLLTTALDSSLAELTRPVPSVEVIGLGPIQRRICTYLQSIWRTSVVQMLVMPCLLVHSRNDNIFNHDLWRVWRGLGTLDAHRDSHELSQVVRELKAKARLLGLGPTAITSVRPSARLSNFEKWLENGYHGELGYMARPDRLARRRDPQIILPGAAAVIMTLMFYWPGVSGFPVSHHAPSAQSCPKRDKTSRGIVSSYAWGADYHGLLENKLKELGIWLHERAGGMGRFYVDTGAVLERDFAERAGLGFIGKNSLLINPKAGSGCFIGGLFTTLPLPPDGDEDRDGSTQARRGRPGCGKCRKCIVACPTGAIVHDRVVDARKCISYLTIELKGAIPEDLRPKIGNRIYGCDICQQVCPWNRLDWSSKENSTKKRSSEPERGAASDYERGKSPLFGSPTIDVTSPDLIELLWATKRSFRARFKGTALERIGRDRLARNAAVALGNIGRARDIGPVGAAAVAHPSQLVRQHAAWALGRIQSRVLLPYRCSETT